MGTEWREMKLGDCITISTSTYSPKEAWPLINYLETGNITDNRISDIQRLVPGIDKIPSRARRKVREGDIVYSTVRPNQRHFGLIKEVPDNLLVSTGFAVIRGKEGLACTDYIYRFLSQDFVVAYLHNIAEHSTSAYPSIKPSDIERIPISLPPLPEQRVIARILGSLEDRLYAKSGESEGMRRVLQFLIARLVSGAWSIPEGEAWLAQAEALIEPLDDKIELNRRMNETLEAIARALFKSWFVDFDPVRAKMEGRDTGLPSHLADLFPDRLVTSELGEIPAGWEVSNLSEIAISPRRSIDPNHIKKDTPYIGLEHMPRRSISLDKWEYSEKVSSNKSVFRKGEFLFGKLRPYFHKVGIAPLNGICSTDIVAIAPKYEFYSSFILSLISSDVFVSYTDQASTGTKMPRTSWKTMGRFPVCIPDETMFQVFEGVIGSNLERITKNVHENHTVGSLRDTLLPKLISGELRVRDAETFLEGAL